MSTGKSAQLAALKLKQEPVEINGVTFIVSQMGASDYIRIFTDQSNKDANGDIDMSKFSPILVACSVVDEAGDRVFDDSEIASLARTPYESLTKLVEVAKRLNGMTGNEIKNSEAGPTDSSPIDSACISDEVTPTN